MILQPGGAQGPAGLGDLDDAVGDVGDLGLAGAVGQAHVGVDAELLEVAAGQLRVLRRHAHPVGELRRLGDRGVAGDGDDHADRVARRLRVLQLAEADDLAARLLDPVAPRDADVEEALGDVRPGSPGGAGCAPRRRGGRRSWPCSRRPTTRTTVRSAASNSSSVARSSEPFGSTIRNTVAGRYRAAGPAAPGGSRRCRSLTRSRLAVRPPVLLQPGGDVAVAADADEVDAGEPAVVADPLGERARRLDAGHRVGVDRVDQPLRHGQLLALGAQLAGHRRAGHDHHAGVHRPVERRPCRASGRGRRCRERPGRRGSRRRALNGATAVQPRRRPRPGTAGTRRTRPCRRTCGSPRSSAAPTRRRSAARRRAGRRRRAGTRRRRRPPRSAGRAGTRARCGRGS